jgi:hypothetical protein
MFKYTTNALNKLEALFEELGYIVRYEKGNFNAGYCILEHKKVVVINKYYTLEARINCLADIISRLEVNTAALSPAAKTVFDKLPQQNLPS